MKMFHAHLYYDQETFETAKKIISLADELSYTEIGRIHERPIGPHPMWSCQILFKTDDLPRILPWLMQNRMDLKVFIHPLSGNDLEDHTIHAMWLGDPVELNLNIFK